MGGKDELSIEPLLAYNIPLMTQVRAPFLWMEEASCGHTGLVEQTECWILSPSPPLSPAYTHYRHSAISH